MKELILNDLFNNNKNALNPDLINSHINDVKQMMLIHYSGIKEVETKLDILNQEFQIQEQRNPIEYVKSRVKSLESITQKLRRRNLPISTKSAVENLHDIAGVRVICSFVDDIYHVAEMLKKQDDITVIEEKDYIKNPKKNGYRSYHLVVEVPVFFSACMRMVKVEVQIRTIAMDFWASLEHKLFYRKDDLDHSSEEVYKKLLKCAQVISQTDLEMQEIRNMVSEIE
ncbi:MAG: GTP pyrophosphokinase family protein [Epulopiscium sp.]|jgi:putative GTP pyrophosphokinase|nr:GTP pyrophosphokinase family protein [Candidatus Epulonipiscium sp.]